MTPQEQSRAAKNRLTAQIGFMIFGLFFGLAQRYSFWECIWTIVLLMSLGHFCTFAFMIGKWKLCRKVYDEWGKEYYSPRTWLGIAFGLLTFVFIAFLLSQLPEFLQYVALAGLVLFAIWRDYKDIKFLRANRA